MALTLILVCTHERAMFIIPALFLYSLHTLDISPSYYRKNFSVVSKLSLNFVIPVIIFYLYKTLFYSVNTGVPDHKSLSIYQQILHLLRAPNPNHSIYDGIFDFVMSPVNLQVWGLFYFSFIIVMFIGFYRRTMSLVLFGASFHILVVSQLLVAEDVHRLTGLLYGLLFVILFEMKKRKDAAAFISLAFLLVGGVDNFSHELYVLYAKMLLAYEVYVKGVLSFVTLI